MNKNSAAILALLRQSGDYISGEGLSRSLGISRTAVWKHVGSLRGGGYQIDAVPSLGYRLKGSPDLLNDTEISGGLCGRVVGQKLLVVKETGSTNQDAFRLAEEGAPDGTVVMAESQTAGKGRLGRKWESPAGVNIYCSVVLRPQIMPYEAPQLTFLSAVAVARAIEAETGLAPSIKWPNDILIDGCKVAGLLNEMSAETDRVAFVVLGIGVNLNMSESQFPKDLRQPATSLAIKCGRKVSRAGFATVMLNELDRCYSDFIASGLDGIRAEWERRCNAYGREVVVESGSSLIQGSFAGIDQDGAMLVLMPDGSRERIISGDVRVL